MREVPETTADACYALDVQFDVDVDVDVDAPDLGALAETTA